MRKDGVDIVRHLESLQGPIDPDERDEIELWQKGRALASVVNSNGWDVVLEILQSYAAKEMARLLSLDPGDKEAVVAAHAVAYTANRIVAIFIDDVQRCIEASQHTPEVVKEGLRKSSPVPPDSLA